MAIGPCALAASPAKYSKEVIEQRAHKVIMEELAEHFDIEHENWDTLVVHAPVEFYILHGLRAFPDDVHYPLIESSNCLDSYGVL